MFKTIHLNTLWYEFFGSQHQENPLQHNAGATMLLHAISSMQYQDRRQD